MIIAKEFILQKRLYKRVARLDMELIGSKSTFDVGNGTQRNSERAGRARSLAGNKARTGRGARFAADYSPAGAAASDTVMGFGISPSLWKVSARDCCSAMTCLSIGLMP